MTDGLLDPLTLREQEILQLLADGLTDQELGERLFLSTGTVKWHIKNIYSKFGMHKRTAVIARAQTLGLLKPHEEVQAPNISPPKHNLPYQTTSFVGRETDTSSILALLADPKCRLVTLVGVGGIGKTRLAIQCAGQLIDSFSDGVFYINFDSVSVSFLPSAIADALNFRTAGKDDLRVQLIRLLRPKKLLLILDSYEHLIGDATFVAQMLNASPGLKIIVTSREVLNLAEEWIYPVEGLSVPGKTDADNIESFGAAKLFIDRAARVHKDFSSSSERVWITRICQLVGGMPLAIELLTTWLNVLNCEEIARELIADRDMIAADRRDLPERQQSIRAVFAQSWDLLTAEEQMIMMNVAVFRGGFTRAAAEQVAGSPLRSLVTLVNKSLISANKDGRHGLHLLLRNFLATKLNELPALEIQTRLLHSQYYARTLRESDIMAHDADNVWTGMAFAIEQHQIGDIAGYVRGLWQHFEARGWYLIGDSVLKLYQDSIGVIEDAIKANPTLDVGQGTQRELYESFANLLYTAQRFIEARTAFETALAHSQSDKNVTQARLYRKIGLTYAAQRGYVEVMINLYKTAEITLGAKPSESDLVWWQEWIQIQLELAWGYYSRHDLESMIESTDQIEEVVQKIGTPVQKGKLHYNHVLIDLRSYSFFHLPDESLYHAKAALNAAQQAGNYQELSWLDFSLGFIHLWRDEMDEAEQWFFRSLEQGEQYGDAMAAHITTLTYLPLVYRRRQDVEAAEHWARLGLERSTDAQIPFYIGTSLANIGWVMYRRGLFDEAKTYCEKTFAVWSEIAVFIPMQWFARIPLLAMALQGGEIEHAVEHARRMLEPKQKILHDPLPALLNAAIGAWDMHDIDTTVQSLKVFCDHCPPLGYL